MQASVLVLLALCGVASAHFGLLKDLNEAQKKELGAILHNQDLTRKQTHEQVKEWVSKQDEKVQKAFEEHQKKREEMKKKHAEKHAEKLKDASPAAKALDEQISTVWKNEDLTKKQVCEQINEIVNKADAKAKEELHLQARDCSKPFRPHGHHGKNQQHHRGARHHDGQKGAKPAETAPAA